MSKQRAHEFSLVEVMVAAGIVAVIAAIALPNLIEARKGANESAAIGAGWRAGC